MGFTDTGTKNKAALVSIHPLNRFELVRLIIATCGCKVGCALHISKTFISFIVDDHSLSRYALVSVNPHAQVTVRLTTSD